MTIYSIYDSVAKEYSAPFVMKNDEVAKRTWKRDCEKVPSEMLKDYVLVSLGMFYPDYDMTESPIKNNKVTVVLRGSDIIAEDTEQLKFSDLKDDEIVEGENI